MYIFYDEKVLVKYNMIKYFQLDFTPRSMGLEIKYEEGRIQLPIMRSTVFVHMCQSYVDVRMYKGCRNLGRRIALTTGFSTVVLNIC